MTAGLARQQADDGGHPIVVGAGDRRAEEALRQSEERFRTLVNDLRVGVLLFGPESEILVSNEAAFELLNISEEDLRTGPFRPDTDMIYEDGTRVPPDEFPVIRATVSRQAVRSIVLGLPRRGSPERRWLLIDADPQLAEDGSVKQVICTFTDISERKRAARALWEGEERYRTLVETSPDSIVLATLDGAIVVSNQPAADLHGYESPEEMTGLSALDLLAPEDRPRARRHARRMLGTGEARRGVEYRMARRDGSVFPAEVSASVLRDADGKPRAFVAVARDITERKQAEATLEHRALHDSLTELPNRVLLHERLQQAILVAHRDRNPLALLVMDLNHFKEINDTFGHHVGDLVLKQLAHRLRATLRESDTVARLSGDEFAMLLPNTDTRGASLSARKVLQALDQPFFLEGYRLEVGASIGIAFFPEHGKDVDTLLHRADVAMYAAKRSEAGFAPYSREQDMYSPNRMALIGELRAAMELNQLVVHYQPKLELETGQVRSVEALMRWQHPHQGLILPDVLIPLAEQSGLIRAICWWVTNESLRQVRCWHDEGLDLAVSINVSAETLHDPQFEDTLTSLMRTREVQSDWLELEVTESALLVEPTRALGILKHLRDINLRIAIDDFGTGYSSLAYLRQLPVDELKIDTSFIVNMAANPDDVSLVRAIIDLGHTLGLKAVAEGVENRSILDLVTALGCDFAQGYQLGPPAPANAIAARLPQVNASR